MNDILKTIYRTESLAGRSTGFCFFVDSIEKYKGDQFGIAQILHSLSQLPSTKLCVASRHLSVFDDVLIVDGVVCMSTKLQLVP